MTNGYSRPARIFVQVAVAVGALTMLGFGVWMRLDPAGFAVFARFPNHVHFLHDAGVFQIGIGLMMLSALVWRDVLSVVLVGFLVANTLHVVNHAADLDLGGNPDNWWQLALLSLLTLAGLVVHRRQLGRRSRARG
ncbi:hypothetical protein ACIBK9_19390 [Nonomuraea sp. NPDC050227]|uniref:hypothetical protein n=1 Tax=Nonomuraea sp. NPDC050227 TaxID=3364360 RepID=UPI0037BB512F